MGLVDRFAFIACREDVPSPKPEPDLYKFGMVGVHAFTAWIISFPLIAGATYYATRPALRRLATALARRS